MTQTIAYDSQGRIASVTDPFGRNLVFGYDNYYRIATMADPASGTYTYAYAPITGALTSVTYPDGKTRTYVYEDPNHNTSVTGIIDENGQRFATYAYDQTTGDAISTQHAGGVGLVTVQPVDSNPNPIVTDALGTQRTFTNTTIHGVQRNTGVSSPGPSVTDSAVSYDTNGFAASRTDFNGNVTQYTRNDPQGRLDLETQRIEALGTPQQRVINTIWHAYYRLPEQIVEPLRTTNFAYDLSGNMLTRTLTTGSGSRTWTYSYNSVGQVLTADGPRTDVSDIATYTYDNQGNLSSVSNALNQITTISSYDAHGRPLVMSDPNGLTTQLSYDPRGRLLSRSVGGEITSYTYDGAGQLTLVTNPDGSSLAYKYDAAHRLIGVSDSLGNSVAYTLDAMGNRLQDSIYDSTQTLAQTKSRIFSSLTSRLYQEIGAVNQTTTFQYDNQGNVTVITDPLNHSIINNYDALNRLSQVTDQLSGNVNYAYDPLNQLTRVSDQRSLQTNYTVDGLGNVTQIQSPDTGTTISTFDSAGNVLTRTDAKGQVTTYTYDALNRVTSVSYATDSTLNVTYTYDQGTNGIGRLTGVTDNAGTIAYAYDLHGRLLTETRTMGGVAYVMSYTYDNFGRLASAVYPSGRQMAYSRDGMGRVNGVATTKNSITQTLLTGVTYRPFGPEQALTFGNGQTQTWSFDLDGRIAGFSFPNQTLALGYDAASRISFISDTANPTNTTNLTYDAVSRLTGFVAPATVQAFGYDAVGNRTNDTINTNSYAATYSSTSNQILQVTGPTPETFSFDANGSIVNDTTRQMVYDARGRMNQSVAVAGTTQYVVNSLGQRVAKTLAGSITVFHYDSGGRLIAESDSLGNFYVEYAYINDIPLVVLK